MKATSRECACGGWRPKPRVRLGDEISQDDMTFLGHWGMPERGRQGLQRWVIDRLKEGGWLYQHNYDSRLANSGFLDVVALRASRLLVIEVKDMAGQLDTRPGRSGQTQAQWFQTWRTWAFLIDPFRRHHVDVLLVRPCCRDWFRALTA